MRSLPGLVNSDAKERRKSYPVYILGFYKSIRLILNPSYKIVNFLGFFVFESGVRYVHNQVLPFIKFVRFTIEKKKKINAIYFLSQFLTDKNFKFIKPTKKNCIKKLK